MIWRGPSMSSTKRTRTVSASAVVRRRASSNSAGSTGPWISTDSARLKIESDEAIFCANQSPRCAAVSGISSSVRLSVSIVISPADFRAGHLRSRQFCEDGRSLSIFFGRSLRPHVDPVFSYVIETVLPGAFAAAPPAPPDLDEGWPLRILAIFACENQKSALFVVKQGSHNPFPFN